MATGNKHMKKLEYGGTDGDRLMCKSATKVGQTATGSSARVLRKWKIPGGSNLEGDRLFRGLHRYP